MSKMMKQPLITADLLCDFAIGRYDNDTPAVVQSTLLWLSGVSAALCYTGPVGQYAFNLMTACPKMSCKEFADYARAELKNLEN